MSRKRPRTPAPGSQPNTERLCIRGIASATVTSKDVAALFSKVGLVATEVAHVKKKDVSFVTVALAAPSSDTSSIDAELRNVIERAVRILQGSRWRGVVLRSIELSKAEHYAARLHRTWDAEAEKRRYEMEMKVANDAGTHNMPKLSVGDVLYVKAPCGMGYVLVSTAPNSSYDGGGNRKEIVYSSKRVTFVDSDEEEGKEGEEVEEDYLSATSSDNLSATSSDDDDDVSVNEHEESSVVLMEEAKEVETAMSSEVKEEVDWDAWLKEKDADEEEEEEEEEEEQEESEKEVEEEGEGEEAANEEAVSEKADVAERYPAVSSSSISLDSSHDQPLRKQQSLSYNEEEWSGSSSDDDENGLNLLQRLKGGGKKKEGSAATTAVDEYDEEAWSEDDVVVAPPVNSKKRKKEKKKEKREKKREEKEARESEGRERMEKREKREKKEQDTTEVAEESDDDGDDGDSEDGGGGGGDGGNGDSGESDTDNEDDERAHKKPKIDPAQLLVLQNKRRLDALARKKKEMDRAAAALTAALAAAPKSKKLTFSSSEEDSDEEENGGGGPFLGGGVGGGVGDDSSGKIVMFSDDDEEDEEENNLFVDIKSNQDNDDEKKSKRAGKSAPCPTSDEARFQLKEDYEGQAGRNFLKLQRHVGSDSRFKMDKDFLDDDDDDDDVAAAADDDEFEKFDVSNTPFSASTVSTSLTDGMDVRVAVGNVEAEVDDALNALRSILGDGSNGHGSSREVKDPYKMTRREKREQQKKAAVGSSRDFNSDMNRYDPESSDAIKYKLDTNREAADKIRERRAAKDAAAASLESGAGFTFNHELESGGGGGGDDDSENGSSSDPSKRHYSSKTNFWTDMYEATKGRKDVVEKKAASAEFRLTDLGLDEQFGLDEESTAIVSQEVADADAASASASASAAAGGGFQFGFAAVSGHDDKKMSAENVVDGEEGKKIFIQEPTINVEFLSFVREGTESEVQQWWEDNRIRLTDGYRKKNRDVLRGRRARQRANVSSWK